MESFIEELKIVLPVIGFDFLSKPVVASKEVDDLARTQQFFKLIHPKKGISARATELEGEFILMLGSIGSLNESQSFDEARQAFRHQVFETGRAIKLTDDTFKTTENIAFSSPSAAAVFLFGTSRNGRTEVARQI
jgi:hypothetical protein